MKGPYDLRLRNVFFACSEFQDFQDFCRACQRNHRKHNGFIGVNVEWTDWGWIIGIIFATYYYIEVFIMLRRTCSPNVTISSQFAPSPPSSASRALRMDKTFLIREYRAAAACKHEVLMPHLMMIFQGRQENLSPGFSRGINICNYIWFTISNFFAPS